MSELMFRFEQLDSITKEVCELCGLDVGVITTTSNGETLYMCGYCKKKRI